MFALAHPSNLLFAALIVGILLLLVSRRLGTGVIIIATLASWLDGPS